MKSGICPKCGSNEVYGDLNSTHGISVDRMSLPQINTILLACSDCGYLEFYIDNEKDLEKVKKRFGRVEG